MFDAVAVLGAGSWGMAIANLLDAGGRLVTLWEFDAAECERLHRLRTIPEKLPSFTLTPSVEVTNDLAGAVAEVSLVVLALPAQRVRSVVTRVKARLGEVAGVVNLSKGIEAGTLKRISEVVVDEIDLPPEKFVTVSGPSHAEEVIRDIPTTVVAAGQSVQLVESVQTVFSHSRFRVYKSDDLIGVELGGSLKNIIAIAAGIADGLGLGDNAKGALLTRGLAEITRLGVAMKARAETFAGLSGVGDLVTTCISKHSRNRHVGERIALGEKLPDILSDLQMVAEGVETARSGYELSRRHQVEMPITSEVYRVLFEGKPAAEALEDLMGRTLKAEIWQ
jgi:glycerol-3-phosphate dehydrogenase (NAD(P)+)